MKGFAGKNFYKPASRADYLVKLIKKIKNCQSKFNSCFSFCLKQHLPFFVSGKRLSVIN